MNNFNDLLSVISEIEDSDSEPHSNMTERIDYQLLKLYLDIIPKFDGQPIQLNKFLSACESLLTAFSRPNNATHTDFLYKAILSKLCGDAEITVASHLNIPDWATLKNILSTKYGDPRDLQCLQQDLIFITIKPKESLLDLGNRIQSILSLMINKLQSSEQSQAEKEVLAKVYSKLALDTFVRNLPSGFQQMIRIQEIDKLDDAIKLVLKEEQFNLYKQTVTAYKPKTVPNQIRPNSQFPFSQASQSRPNFNMNQNYRPTNIPPQFSTQPLQTGFPSQPINIQPRQNFSTKQNFPTNRQVFGPPRNVFKNPPPANIRPTPMSTTSRNPTVQKPMSTQFTPRQPQNWQQYRQQTPKYHTEELFYAENDQPPYSDTDYMSQPIPSTSDDNSYLENLYYQAQSIQQEIEQHTTSSDNWELSPEIHSEDNPYDELEAENFQITASTNPEIT